MSIQQVHDAINACRECEAFAAGYVKPAPMARGQAGEIVIVGQGPGNAETGSGRPFAGQSGRRLDQWLVEAGADPRDPRAGIYLTSVLKCGTTDTSGKRFNRMIYNCASFLERQIRAIRPSVVVTLGKVAFKRIRLTAAPYGESLCLPVDSADVALLTEFGFHFVHLPWPHPSGLNRQLNDPEIQRRLAQSFDILRPILDPDGDREP